MGARAFPRARAARSTSRLCPGERPDWRALSTAQWRCGLVAWVRRWQRRLLVAALDPLDPGLAGGELFIRLCEVTGGLALGGWVLRCVVSLALVVLIRARCIQPVHRRFVGFSALARVLGIVGDHLRCSCLPRCSRPREESPSRVVRRG